MTRKPTPPQRAKIMRDSNSLGRNGNKQLWVMSHQILVAGSRVRDPIHHE
jgi:hypothetical protein